MKDTSRSMDVLKKLLKTTSDKAEQITPQEKLIEKYLQPGPHKAQILHRKPGRPVVEDHLKARNFTLCLAPKYLIFLDQMKMKDKKIQGRGRKIRYIIDQFIEMHRRQKQQLQVLNQSLLNVETLLKGFSGQVQKGQKLDLTPREKAEITKVTSQVKVLLSVLKYTPKDLHKMLPRSEWSILSFCLDWNQEKGIK